MPKKYTNKIEIVGEFVQFLPIFLIYAFFLVAYFGVPLTLLRPRFQILLLNECMR